MMKKIGYLIGSIFAVASLPFCFAYGIGLLDSDEMYLRRSGMSIEEALEKGVLEHPENYSGHCDFSQLPEYDENTTLEELLAD